MTTAPATETIKAATSTSFGPLKQVGAEAVAEVILTAVAAVQRLPVGAGG